MQARGKMQNEDYRPPTKGGGMREKIAGSTSVLVD